MQSSCSSGSVIREIAPLRDGQFSIVPRQRRLSPDDPGIFLFRPGAFGSPRRGELARCSRTRSSSLDLEIVSIFFIPDRNRSNSAVVSKRSRLKFAGFSRGFVLGCLSLVCSPAMLNHLFDRATGRSIYLPVFGT